MTDGPMTHDEEVFANPVDKSRLFIINKTDSHVN